MLEFDEATVSEVSGAIARAGRHLRGFNRVRGFNLYTTVPSVQRAFLRHASLYSGQPGSMTATMEYLGRQIDWLAEMFTATVNGMQTQDILNAMSLAMVDQGLLSEPLDKADLPMPPRDMSTIIDLAYASPIAFTEMLTPLDALIQAFHADDSVV